MESLALAVTHAEPSVPPEQVETGVVALERQGSRAVLLTPERIDRTRRYPLVTVLHGAGRQDELLARVYADEAQRRGALFLIPRSYDPTWDLLVGGAPHDLEFLGHLYGSIYARYPIDPARQGLVGYSDGASYALAVGLSNPRVFAAVAGWAAGFLAIDTAALRPGDPKPRVLLEYGTNDPIFPFEMVALPNRAALERLGYAVTFRVDEGGVHWPSRGFQGAALDWMLAPSEDE